MKTENHRTGKFQLSRFTIRAKLMAIISAIILTAMSFMIFIASLLFSQNIELRVQENNLNLVEVIGQKTQSEFNSVFKNTIRLFESEQISKNEFFTNNPEVVFAGIAKRVENTLHFKQSYYQQSFLQNHRLEVSDIQRIHDLNADEFLRSFAGDSVVRNVSAGFAFPLLGVSRPTSGDIVLVVYLDAELFLKPFSEKENEHRITQVFMVNREGTVIAHPDTNLVLSRTNLSDLKIVNMMQTSPVDLGQTVYTDNQGTEFVASFKKLNFGGLGLISAAESERVFAGVREIQRDNILLLLIVVNVSLLIVFYFAKSLTRPITRLVRAVRDIQEGEFDVELQPAARDEIGLLTDSVSRMAVGLGERDKVKDALSHFVNPEIAEKVIKGEIELGGEERHCAVFFSDLRGFTAMSEKMKAEEIVNYLNRYFQEMVNCISLTSGIVDKFIGDAIMAHWGAFYSAGNDTELAVNTALLMRRTLMQFNKTVSREKPFTRFGCGINTGPVVAGQIGSTEHYEFTVIGDTVNLASRIEALNKPFGTDILISEDSLRLVSGLYLVEKMPSIKVKGKSEPQSIYAVINRSDIKAAPQTLDEVREMARIEAPAGTEMNTEGEVKYEILGA